MVYPVFKSCGFLAVLTLVNAAPVPPSGFDHHLPLFPDVYDLYWKVIEDEIHFEVQVKTLGYVGFGISPNGGMKGADIVTGWVKDDVAYFQDRHSTGNSQPEIDEEQNWFLLEANEADGYTTLRFKRNLETCDDNDLIITAQTIRIIYAYHSDDPVGENSTEIIYHGNNRRGTKSITLVISNKQQLLDKMPEYTDYIDFLNPNVTIPDTDTTYWCQTFLMPNHDKKHHVIRFEPIIAPGNEAFVHHISMHACTHITNATQFVTKGAMCFGDLMGEAAHCTSSIFTWAVGGNPVNLPDHVGYPISDGRFSVLRMTVHYDNPALKSGVVDNSGMRFYYTSNLKQYDAAILAIQAAADRSLVIPPKFEKFVRQGHCTPECSTAAIPEGQDLKLFAVRLHGHYLARKAALRHFRNGIELPYIVKDQYYDFNYQQMRLLPEEVIFKRGDTLMVECEYNSMERTNLTFGGDSSKEEMCNAFILYYPKVAWARCVLSIVPLNLIGFINPETEEQRNPSIAWFNRNYHFKITSPKEFATTNYLDVFYKIDWSDPKWRKRYQDHILHQDGYNLQYCNENYGQEIMRRNMYYVPEIKEVYTPPDKCSGSSTRTAWNGIYIFALFLRTYYVLF